MHRKSFFIESAWRSGGARDDNAKMRKRLGFREWEHLSDCTGLFVPVEVEVPVKTRLKSEWESGRVGPQAADDAEASALSAGTRALLQLKS